MQLIRCLLSKSISTCFGQSLCPSSVHTAYDPAPHNHSQHNQCRTPHAVIHGLVLLMMGIMMHETCWDRSLIINIGLISSCWFTSLHHTFHDARSQELKIHDDIALRSAWNEKKCFRQKLQKKNKETLCIPKSRRLWDNGGKILWSWAGHRWQYGACALHVV